MRYDRARVPLDPHATHIVAAYLAGPPAEPQSGCSRARTLWWAAPDNAY